MTSAATALGTENLTLNLNLETRVRASLDATFAAMLDELGPASVTPEGKPFPLKLEAWPGGRWYRDLSDGNGHYWGTVQAIKRPTLLEICGPLFMSYAVINNVQYRLSEVEGGTLIVFHHYAFGVIPDDVRQNITKGWTHILDSIRARSEKSR